MIETDRLVLRKPVPEDAAAFAPLLADPVVMHFIGGVDDAETAVARWLDRWEANGVGHFVIVRRADGLVLGRSGFVVWDTSVWRATTRAEAGEHVQEELGWMLGRAHRGRATRRRPPAPPAPGRPSPASSRSSTPSTLRRNGWPSG